MLFASANANPTAINHDKVIDTMELPHGGGKMFVTARTESELACYAAAGKAVEPYSLYQTAGDKIIKICDVESIDEAKEIFHESYDAVIYAHARDEYFAEWNAERKMQEEIEDIWEENADRVFEKWLDKYED